MSIYYKDKLVAGAGQGGVSSSIPAGVIVIWSGAADNIPEGWQLCDGTNDTPDLRSRFVLGAGGKYNPDAIGGAETVTLTTAEMPKHRHYISAIQTSIKPYSGGTATPAILQSNTSSYTYSDYQGSGSAHNNMPPYYALCYIMKL